MSALRGSLALGGALLLLALDGRTWLGLEWPAGARLGLCAGWASLVALWPGVAQWAPGANQKDARASSSKGIPVGAHTAADAAVSRALPASIGPYAALLWPLPALAAAGVLDWVAGAGVWDLARALLLWLAVALAGAWVRAGRSGGAATPLVWQVALGSLAVTLVLALCADQLGQPGPGGALFGWVPLLQACPPLGSFLAAQGAGWTEAQIGWAAVLLALAAFCQAQRARNSRALETPPRWPALSVLAIAALSLQPGRALGSVRAEPLLVSSPGIASLSAVAAPRAALNWPERLGSLPVRLHGPLSAVELRLAGQVLCALSLDLPSGEVLDLELPFVWRDPLQIEPELQPIGPGKAEVLGPARRHSAPAVALQLLQRPIPEPAPEPGSRLPIWSGLLLFAYWFVLCAAPRGSTGAAKLGRFLAFGLLPVALSGWLVWRLALPREAPVRSTIELLDPLGPALLQRVGRGVLPLSGRPESLVTWPEWAPASLVGSWRWPSGVEQWGANAPGARLVERRFLAAPADASQSAGLPRWRRAGDGSLEPIDAGQGWPAASAPIWALWAAPPGQRLELAWSGREGDPVWRLGGQVQPSAE